MHSNPAIPMLARQDKNGEFVESSAVCAHCSSLGFVNDSFLNWIEYAGASIEAVDSTLYPTEQEGMVCIECGARPAETDSTVNAP